MGMWLNPSPKLVGPHNPQLAQEIGIDLVPRCWLRGAGVAIDGLDRHLLHQARDMAAPDRDTFLAQEIAQHPASCERKL